MWIVLRIISRVNYRLVNRLVALFFICSDAMFKIMCSPFYHLPRCEYIVVCRIEISKIGLQKFLDASPQENRSIGTFDFLSRTSSAMYVFKMLGSCSILGASQSPAIEHLPRSPNQQLPMFKHFLLLVSYQ